MQAWNGEKIGSPTNLEQAGSAAGGPAQTAAAPVKTGGPARAAPSKGAGRQGKDMGPLYPIEGLSPYQNK